MFGYGWEWNSPQYLWLLAVLPLVWFFSYRSLAGLGHLRRVLALAFRTIVLLTIIFALAEFQIARTSEKVTVIYVLDQSASIPVGKRNAMMKYVVTEVAKHRNEDREDRAGVIVFAKEALVETPPFDQDIPSSGVIEVAGDLRVDASNLAAALKLAQASFPEDSANRIVLVTDGNENIGDARTVASMLADDSVGIDVVPVELEQRGEVVVEKLTLPPDIRRGQPVEARVVLNNYGLQPVPGKLRVVQQFGKSENLIRETEVVVRPGKQVFSFRHEIEKPAVYTYKATFTAESRQDDALVENNETTAFTHVRGKGRLMLIEDFTNPGEFDFLVERLRANNIEVDIRGTDELFTSLAELQGYDCVVLANTPRSSGEDAQQISSFSDAQIKMLVTNTEQMGCGLVMLGGPNAFGAGGWANTDLEKAMPVDFQIKNAEVKAVGALVLMMHASEMSRGNYWQGVVARKAIDALGPMDYCGLVHWDNTKGRDDWLWARQTGGLLQVGPVRKKMLASVSRMQPGDMPQFDPAMQLALTAFVTLKNVAAVKHMIVISDGDPSPPNPATVAAYNAGKIQISTVAIGSHGPAGSQTLQALANATGGKYYAVTNPQALPKIYQREARRISRPLVFEPETPISPQVVYPHEMLGGLERNERLPPIDGFVLTEQKDSPLVEVSIRSPLPKDNRNNVILASWTYGFGRTLVFTSDAGERWADRWTNWENYDRFFVQMMRWAMRPVDQDGNFDVATSIKDGKVRVVVTAMDNDNEFMNLLQMSGAAVTPDLESLEVPIRQTAPGRYEGEFEADKPGSFFVTINPGMMEDPETGQPRPRPPIVAGVTAPYSAEYRDRETNLALLKAIANLRPQGGEAGLVIEGDVLNTAALTEADTFRHTLKKAVSIQDVWPWVLLFGSCVFFADVFVRRVTFDYEWIRPGVEFVRRSMGWEREETPSDDRLARLRSRKAEVGQQMDERRAAARFEPDMAQQADSDLDAAMGRAPDAPPTPRPTAQPSVTPEQEQEGYTSRLLKAKKKAWKDEPDN